MANNKKKNVTYNDELSDDQRVMLDGVDAKALANNPAYQKIFGSIESGLLGALEDINLANHTDAALDIVRNYQILKNLKGQIDTMITNGEVAKLNIQEEQEEKEFEERTPEFER